MVSSVNFYKEVMRVKSENYNNSVQNLRIVRALT
jgi:hypothetical protein